MAFLLAINRKMRGVGPLVNVIVNMGGRTVSGDAYSNIEEGNFLLFIPHTRSFIRYDY